MVTPAKSGLPLQLDGAGFAWEHPRISPATVLVTGHPYGAQRVDPPVSDFLCRDNDKKHWENQLSVCVPESTLRNSTSAGEVDLGLDIRGNLGNLNI
jgi:hypothetical protein